MNKIKNYFKRLYDIVMKPEMKVLPGELAFFLFLSLVPIITLVLYVGLILSIGTDSVAVFINKVFPTNVSDILVPYVNDVGIDFSTIISMISGFLIASNGANSLIITSNTLYKIEHKNYFKRLLKSLFMTILLVILFIFIIVVLAFGDKIVKFLISLSIFENISYEIQIIYSISKWPFAYMNRGALFTTIMWLLITIIYTFYINNYANYNLFYGSLANIVVIMLWVYALSFALVVGMAINNEHYIMANKN